MPETLQFRLVDAFAEKPFSGNPAGVVFGADQLDDSQMLRLAREVNASETAFLSRLNDLHRPPLIRWFSPTQEVSFCGHATLAAAQALLDTGCLARVLAKPTPRLVLESAAGELGVTFEQLPEPYRQPLWWLDLPDAGLRPDNTNPIRTCELLGISDDVLDPSIPPMRTRDEDLIYVIKDFQTLFEMKPKFAELGAWCERSGLRGICVATMNTLADSIDVQSRFFAPAVGIDEDPVTGSVHGPLGIMLVINGVVGNAAGKSALNCIQGRPGDRTGLVRVLVEKGENGYASKIGGLCFTTLAGDFQPPPRD